MRLCSPSSPARAETDPPNEKPPTFGQAKPRQAKIWPHPEPRNSRPEPSHSLQRQIPPSHSVCGVSFLLPGRQLNGTLTPLFILSDPASSQLVHTTTAYTSLDILTPYPSSRHPLITRHISLIASHYGLNRAAGSGNSPKAELSNEQPNLTARFWPFNVLARLVSRSRSQVPDRDRVPREASLRYARWSKSYWTN